MASRQQPLPEQTPVQAVPEPILCNPYEEPKEHWIYRDRDGVPERYPERRSASYWYRTTKTGSRQQAQSLFAEEERDDLPLINALRKDVKRWRESGYRGVTRITRELLDHWAREDAPRRLFFCQREAVETLIYLLELRIPGRSSRTGFQKFECGDEDIERMLRNEKPQGFDLPEKTPYYPSLVDPPSDSDLLPLLRLGCKMATGAGKTVVMAMMIAWAFCNRGRNPQSRRFPHAVLICAPNLTIKKRLQILRPDHPHNYYDEFEIVPSRYREFLNAGRILVTNWHAFLPKSPHSEGGTTYKVVDKGEEDQEAFTLDRLGELAERLPILVLNDEGHHCWRPKIDEKARKKELKGLSKEEKQEIEEEAEEARVWLAGLDKINNAGLLGDREACILAAIDLSATPFFIKGSGHPDGRPFPWLVSDFGLVDAIESGIVKIPRLPVMDDQTKKDEVGRPDPRYFRLWKHINDDLGPNDRTSGGRPKPEAVFREAEGALHILAGQWREKYETIRNARPSQETIPPVMIVVCDNTEIARYFFEQISGEREKEVLNENGKTVKKKFYENSIISHQLFKNSEHHLHTIRIDSKLLDKIGDDEAERHRQIVDTVGKRGQPGENVRCVVSVSMLTEGWDANNVTHILGVRAFDSQLLCEQVVGRGLRRMSYTPDPEDDRRRFVAEHVDVYGIPFSLIPFKGRTKDAPDEDRPKNHVYAVPEREAYEIRVPQVESYIYELRDCGITCDVDQLEELIVDEEPTMVYLKETRGYDDRSGPGGNDGLEFEKQDRSDFYASTHLQAILFQISRQIVEELVLGIGKDHSQKEALRLKAKHQLFPAVFGIVREYVNKKVQTRPGVNIKELGLQKYVQLAVERIRDGIQAVSAHNKQARLFPNLNSYRPYLSTKDVDYTTIRAVLEVERSHLNAVMYQQDWERQAAEVLDKVSCVEYFAANDSQGLSLKIPYQYQESDHLYIPDFIVGVRGGKLVLLEIKGGAGEIHDPDRVNAKNIAARKWVEAVNNDSRFGEWTFEICRDIDALVPLLEQHATPVAEALPFEIVTPSVEERYKTCVPLVNLKAAAGAFSEEQGQQSLWTIEWAEEWVQFAPSRPFREGMFVAQVRGKSMEPRISDGSYCLFAPPPAGSRSGRILLIAHRGITDPVYGGHYTVKRYRSEKSPTEEGDWAHTRIILEPLNPDFDPIILTPEDEEDVRIVAEFVEVIG